RPKSKSGGVRAQYCQEVLSMIPSLRKNVLLTGSVPVDRIHEIYLLGDIMVVPARAPEGFIITLAEAGATGLPVISTRLGGTPEIVIDGVTGLLVNNPDDVPSLTQKILDLMEDKEKRLEMGCNASTYIKNNFSWEKITQKAEEFYCSLIAA
ncbi:MAG TPA: glycosyltransferase, partial [Candidatus Omnitrophica bacterium]|nr:glycosyltransferase [Candidatus Omnitrophota bacterium]